MRNLRAIRAVRVISREWHTAATVILYLSRWNAIPDLVVSGSHLIIFTKI